MTTHRPIFLTVWATLASSSGLRPSKRRAPHEAEQEAIREMIVLRALVADPDPSRRARARCDGRGYHAAHSPRMSCGSRLLGGGLPFEAFPVFSECKHRRGLNRRCSPRLNPRSGVGSASEWL